MTIQEAIKANETQKVISPDGSIYQIGEMQEACFNLSEICGEWSVVREPLRGWVNVYSDGRAAIFCSTKEQADREASQKRIRCAEMVEVLPEVKP